MQKRRHEHTPKYARGDSKLINLDDEIRIKQCNIIDDDGDLKTRMPFSGLCCGVIIARHAKAASATRPASVSAEALYYATYNACERERLRRNGDDEEAWREWLKAMAKK